MIPLCCDQEIMNRYLDMFYQHFSLTSHGLIVSNPNRFVITPLDVDLYRTSGFTTEINKTLNHHEHGWALFVVVPSPYLYYFNRFGCFPLVVGDNVETEDSYFDAINYGPGGSLADAIAVRGEVVVWCSDGGRCIMIFDQQLESAALYERRGC